MIKRIAKSLLNTYADSLANAKGFHFPKKFTWRWKLRMLKHNYEPETTRALREIVKPGMTAVDIGAHIGYFTRLLSEQVGTSGSVYAFEPEPYNYRLLKQNTGILTNVHVYDKALVDSGGSVDLYKTPYKTGCHSVVPGDVNATVRMTVNADSFDGFVERFGIDKVDVIKMDIEGGEPRALQGMLKTIHSSPSLTLVTEANPGSLEQAGSSFEAFITTLRGLGFRCYYLTAEGRVAIEDETLSEAGEYYKGMGRLNILCQKGGT